MLHRSLASNLVLRNFFPARRCRVQSTYQPRGSAAHLHSGQSHPSGLFSIPDLCQPSDFEKLAGNAISLCNEFRNELSGKLQNPTFLSSQREFEAHEVLFQLDSISKHVCNVIDAAELCRSVHTSESWKDGANRAFSILSDYIAELNADLTLYHALAKVMDESEKVSPPFSEEDHRFCSLLRAEFERDGIHLPDQQREQVRHLQGQISHLETLFTQNIIHCKKFFDVDGTEVESIFPQHVLDAYGMRKSGSGSFVISTDSDISNMLGKFSAHPSLRRQVHMESTTACAENLEVLDALIRLRHEVSTLLGFDSYAERFLKDKMAKNQKNVLAFLNQLQQRTQRRYKQEMETIRNVKKNVEGVQDGTVHPWDIPFYTAAIKANEGTDSSSLSSFLSLNNCLEGMRTMVLNLFGIHMNEVEMTKEDRWDTLQGGDSEAGGSGLRRFEFVTQEGDSLGTMYLDLHSRDGKYGHAAHFTVRCGCIQNSPIRMGQPQYQLPVVALVCNIGNSARVSDSVPLSHHEMETLLHEFGHALHSLLSRTKYQHMSGTRAAMDFVETPSHLIENFAWDPQFLKIVGKHQLTGEGIPDKLIMNLRKSRYMFQAIERQNQIIYALFDQKIFGTVNPSGLDTTKVFAELHREYGVPYADGTHWHTRFGHLVSYGAGYYGYMYAQVFAGDIWKASFEGNSLSRNSGEALWKKMLIHGGSRDPNLMLYELLGRAPIVDFND